MYLFIISREVLLSKLASRCYKGHLLRPALDLELPVIFIDS